MKESLRKNIQNILRDFSKEQINKYSESITQKLIQKIQEFDSRFIYLATDNEVQTYKFIDLLHQHGKKVLVPIINGNEMIPVILETHSELKIGKFGIQTVINPVIYKGKIDVAIVPGLAFNKTKSRLGRGRGYFDKFLAKYTDTYKIGICFPQQLIDTIPLETNDILMDEIIY